jgi:hypothetical protein
MKPGAALSRAIPVAVILAGCGVMAGLYIEHRNKPVNALRAKSPISFDAPATPGAIVDAIAQAYGVYVNLEYPNDPGGEPAFLPDMQPSAEIGDSLQEFFDVIEAESNGLLTGLEIGGALCIVPKNRLWTEHRSNLDRIIVANIEGVSAADALYSIAHAVNQYSVEGYPLKLNPGGIRAGFLPPPAFQTAPAKSLKSDAITAREAICRVLAGVPYPTMWVYGHVRDSAYLTVRFYENGKLVKRKGTPEELAAWSNYAGITPKP